VTDKIKRGDIMGCTGHPGNVALLQPVSHNMYDVV